MLDQKPLSEFSVGDEILMFLIVSKCETKTAKNGKLFLNLELRDKSASLPSKVWDNAEEYAKKLKEGTVVKVAGLIEDFNGAPQIKIEKIRPALENDNVIPEDFLPRSSRPFDEMMNELNIIIESISDPFLSRLTKTILSGDSLDKYTRTPAGKGWHHAYIHGLLEHTLEIVRICELMCSMHSGIRRDLLLCGALLHDFGKTEELTYDSVFDYSDKGKLLGHITIGAMTVDRTAASIPDFPEDLKIHLIHLILSHQGKLEYASPVEPKTLEAIVLYQADELSAKTNAYKYAIEADKLKGGRWTRFLPLAETSLFIPDDNSTERDSK
ncbi:MAG: hydrolase [Ignavibacteriae bacterium HGW-Ignavibacteriae-3]|nr:MAG: hydrolase [Ignavibacteriae bacterium HGW-Ignavibacteriae-3]